MLHVSKKDTVSFQTGDSSTFVKSKNAYSERPDPNTLIFEARGRSSVLLNFEVQE